MIEFRDGLFADFAAVQAASAQIGSNVLNAVLLKNVTPANLHQNDFLLS